MTNYKYFAVLSLGKEKEKVNPSSVTQTIHKAVEMLNAYVYLHLPYNCR